MRRGGEAEVEKECGTIVILTFPIAATLAVTSLLHNPLWSASRGLLIFGIVLVWIGMVAYFASIILARIKDPKAGEARILRSRTTPGSNGT